VLYVENWGFESKPRSPLTEGELKPSRLELAYFMENRYLPRPVGEFGGAESGVGEFHSGEWFSVLFALRLGDMVHPDPCDLGLVEDGLEFVAKEYADLGLIAQVASEVGEEGVCDDEVQLGLVNEPAGVGEERFTGADGLGAEL
jgi:hypothetical protein